jgi:hypothetical protein
MHLWGEKDVDWKGINDAAEYIGESLRWWRVPVTTYKEKYGTVRVYCGLGLWDLHQLTHPGYVYNQWPEWAWKLQFTWPAKILVFVLNGFFCPAHRIVYRYYYWRARRKWPHLAEEIYRGCDHHELLGARIAKVGKSNIIWWPEWDEEPTEENPYG